VCEGASTCVSSSKWRVGHLSVNLINKKKINTLYSILGSCHRTKHGRAKARLCFDKTSFLIEIG
jgi:hypothetical protein